MSLYDDRAIGLPLDAIGGKPTGSAARSRLAVRIGAVLLAAIATAAFGIVYVHHEQPAYFWDWSGYFTSYHHFGALLEKGGFDWLGTLLYSVRNSDYNLAILVPLMPSYAMFGGARTVYIATILVLYLLPAACVSACLATRVQSAPSSKPAPWLLATALFFWPFWFAAIRGMPDVAGIIPLGCATLLILDSRYLTRASIQKAVAIGLLVWLTFLLRRWYAYACVALELTTIVFAAGTSLRNRSSHPDYLRAAATALLVNILVIVACLLGYQMPLVIRILHTSYADLYLAYQQPLSATGRLFYAQSGLFFVTTTAVGLARAGLERNDKIAFVTLLAALTAFLFLRTQAPGIQHVLPVFFWLFPAFMFGASWPFAARSKILTFGLPLVMLASFLAVFAPPVHQALAGVSAMLPTQVYFPLRIANRSSYDGLIADIKALAQPRNGKVAVFASSPDLNDTLLFSLDPALSGTLVGISNVDARDGLDLAPLKAEFAVVTSTPALHLPPWSQKVVSVPNMMIVEGSGPGAAYHKASGPYALDNGVIAFIYRRDRPLSDVDRQALTRSFQTFYPGWAVHGDMIEP